MAATAPRNGSIWPTSPLCASAGWESFVLFRLEIRMAALWHPKITKSHLGFNGNTCGFRMKMFDFFYTYLYVFLYFQCHYNFVRHPPVFPLNPLRSDPSTDCILPYWLTATWGYYLKERLLSLHKPPSVSKTFGPFILTKEKIMPLGSLRSAPLRARARSMGFVVQSFYYSSTRFRVDLYNPLQNPPRISDPSSGEFSSSRLLKTDDIIHHKLIQTFKSAVSPVVAKGFAGGGKGHAMPMFIPDQKHQSNQRSNRQQPLGFLQSPGQHQHLEWASRGHSQAILHSVAPKTLGFLCRKKCWDMEGVGSASSRTLF